MKFFDWFGVGDEISKPIDAVSKLYTTDRDRLEAEQKMQETLQRPNLAQLEINKMMVQSGKFFEAAWPGLIGWTAGACFALYYVPQLIVANIIWTMNCIESKQVIAFPIESGDIIHVVYLILGFGTYHFAKKKLLKK